MIPYELIIPSASRPHLFRQVLPSILHHVGQLPERVIVHDDAVFPGRHGEVLAILYRACDPEVLFHKSDPPKGHGPALKWLLDQVDTEFVLYSQDDHVVLRDLPIAKCLELMQAHGLHHVRFNKRATMEYKETHEGRWYKKECVIPVPLPQNEVYWSTEAGDPSAPTHAPVTVTVSDHWYFQTSLWRVSVIKSVVDWFMAHPHEGKWFHEHPEAKINKAMDGAFPGFPLNLIDLPAPGESYRDPDVRQRVQRTFIWGKIGEDRYIQHIGDKPEDWAGKHERRYGG